ncbi:Myb family transcription factor EFM [Melia azedarach]|uniref:Myb family transcription factor EFM n=1 Tax=Melia azedarach TaxID=155640 RepID=A0ACC1XXZ1_MELAZ|nr:Myb family transcription factor EFM [Melia azedarach]
MGTVPPELSLDFRPTFVPKTITDFLRDVSMIGNVSEKVSKLDGFVKRLEEEMRKIDAFKRELPLCMLLLNDAILVLKEESMQCITASKKVQPVLEEFIPLKKNTCEDEDEDVSPIKKEKDSSKDNKKNWMSSVQLWNTDDHQTSDPLFETKQNPNLKIKRNEEENPLQACKRAGARAFMPFKTYPVFARKEEKEELPVHGLSLVTPGMKNPREDTGSSGSRTSCSKSVSSSAPNMQSNLRTGPQPPQQQTTRKQRRCWSPELHRRFVSALQQLGGSQVATPKQIRELMQVDGLTNDEVKSHLQKYRLHTRRTPSATSPAPANQSTVVLGSLWMSPDQYGDSSKASSSQSGSPQGPLQLGGNTGGTSTTGGDSMEDDEDAKSEGYSWKSHIHRPGKDNV